MPPETIHPQQTRPWTTQEIATLTTHAHLGATHLAAILNRTPTAIRMQANRLRISLRTPGQRRGLTLGQPRGTRIPTHIRDRATTDPTTTTRIAQTANNPGPLCPMCGTHPITDPTRNDTCRPCRLRALIAGHQTAQAIEDATRAITAARQAKHRAALARANQLEEGTP